jgi:nucleoside-diphosphate-sugar epimerase
MAAGLIIRPALPKARRGEMVAETVLVTGGCGFIGHRLVGALRESDHSVRVLDIPRGDFSHVEAMGAKVFRGSVTDGESVQVALGNSRLVFHLVAPEPAITDEAFIRRMLVAGAEVLMEEVEDTRVRQVLTTSTTTLYRPSNDVVDEDHPIKTGNSWERAELDMEFALRKGARRSGVNVTCLRLPNVYGRGDGGIVDLLARHIRDPPGGELVIPTKGWVNTVHVDDVIDAARQLTLESRELFMRRKEGEGWFEVLNCTDNIPLTVKELVATISKALGVAPPKVRAPGMFRKPGTWFTNELSLRLLERTRVSNESLKDLCGEWPRFPSLEEGLPGEVR